jgi:aspartate racemase
MSNACILIDRSIKISVQNYGVFVIPRTIGVVGGAGPLAGVRLLDRIFSIAGKKYGCHHDRDFPKVLLVSFPFSDMLSPDKNDKQVRKELRGCLNQLRKNDAQVLAIACNTLHGFLEKEDDKEDLVHLPRALAELELSNPPLILCTSTSAKFRLHEKFLPCSYPTRETQQKIDHIIDQTLKGQFEDAFRDLEKVIEKQPNDTVILGCTELSLYNEKLSISGKQIIDPLELVAHKVLERSFAN